MFCTMGLDGRCNHQPRTPASYSADGILSGGNSKLRLSDRLVQMGGADRGSLCRQGFEVTLTPRSKDKGRDIIASSSLGKIRVIDQVKADRPGHVVPAEEVRAMVGVLVLEGNVSKKFVTTTSSFAPGIARDPDIARLMC
jgi:hypothetical protein